ncbi:MAG: hypothetical protein AAFW89_02755 [Bacteroidota bacterium]
MEYGVRFIMVLGAMLALSVQVSAQFSVQHQAPTALSRSQINALEFVVPGLTPNEVQEAILFYRFDGDFGYNQTEAVLTGSSFRFSLDLSVSNASQVEYYFQLNLINGQSSFFPETLPAENPIEVAILEEISDAPVLDRIEEIDYTILSPNPGGGVTKDNMVISITMFYDEQEVPEGEFRLFLDEEDVTELADTSAYYISYIPKSLRQGLHTSRLVYRTESETFLVAEWSFSVVDPGQASFSGFTERNLPVGNIELTARNQVLAGEPNNAYTGRAQVSGRYGLFRYSGNAFLTTQESSRLQPQNRFGASARLGEYLLAEAGHIFPNMSRFTIAGRRVYGFHSRASVLWDNLNLQFIYGDINRSITNRYLGIDTETVSLDGEVIDTTYTLQFQNDGRGTFRREIIAGRLALGNERHFQIGAHVMKVEDDTTSIFNVVDFEDLTVGGTESASLLSQLSLQDQNRLRASPELLRVNGGSPRPRGNLVAGATLKMGFDRNRIRLDAETSASALNNDIYGGPLTIERADELGFDLDQDDVDLLNDLSTYIIVNENMSTLPLRLFENEEGDLDSELFFPTSILGSFNELSFNYPKNTLRVQYRWIGPDFNSLANTTIRKDIAGFTITDRFRLIQNQVYVTLGIERLEDNLTGFKTSTTVSDTYRTNVSWFSNNFDIPRINVGFRFRTRSNGIERFNANVPEELVLASVLNFSDSLLTSAPRSNTTLNVNSSITKEFMLFDIRHNVSLNVSSLTTNDDVFAFGDVNSRSFSLNVGSQFFDRPLRTQFGVNLNQTESGSGLSEIDIFGIFGGGNYFFLDGKLNVNAQIAFTSNRTRSRTLTIVDDPGEIVLPDDAHLDDDPLNDFFQLAPGSAKNNFGTSVLQAGAQYNLTRNHAFVFTASFTNVSNSSVGNDRIVQLRYLFNF